MPSNTLLVGTCGLPILALIPKPGADTVSYFMSWVASMAVAGYMAYNRDRNVAGWVIAALFFSWLAVIALAVVGNPPRVRGAPFYPQVQQTVNVTVPGAQVSGTSSTPSGRSKSTLPGPLYREVVELVLANLDVEQELLRARAAIVAYRIDNDLDARVTDDDALAVLERVKVSLGLLPEPDAPRSVEAKVSERAAESVADLKTCRECGAPAEFGTRLCECGTAWPTLTWEEFMEVRRSLS